MYKYLQDTGMYLLIYFYSLSECVKYVRFICICDEILGTMWRANLDI